MDNVIDAEVVEVIASWWPSFLALAFCGALTIGAIR